MTIYGDRYVNQNALKRWAHSLSTTQLNQVDIGGENIDIIPEMKKVLDLQISAFAALVDNMKPGDDWRSLQGVLSPLFFNAFFRLDNSSIRVGNFYECLITPSNMKTYKRIMRGFDCLEMGSVQLYDKKVKIGQIGGKSDLIWSVFYDYFINEGYWGDITHTHFAHERCMSIQLYDVENYTYENLIAIRNEILLKLSMEHELDFKVVTMDPIYKQEGTAGLFGMQFHGVELEHIPALYFSNALHAQDIRLAYLSYYQVLEYFFVRAQNYLFLNQYGSLGIPPVNHNELRKVLKKYKDSLREIESLKLVLAQGLNISTLKDWVFLDANRTNIICHSPINAIDFSKTDEKIIGKLADRIYSMRCSIAHAKGDVDEYVSIPSISDHEVEKEIELIKYIAYEILKSCSEL